MELSLSNTLLAGDPRLVDHIVGEVKSQGIFDQFRKECIADVDTKPAYQNLHTRVEGSVKSFLDKQSWKPDLNKNQLRETLRKQLHEASYLDAGVERIVDQVVNPKVFSIFMPHIEDVVYKFLGLERPKTKDRNGGCGFKDLLPKDLDPVSPESDKNSLKDVSLESVDAIDDLDAEKNEMACNEQMLQDKDLCNEKEKDIGSENGQIAMEEKMLDDTGKISNKSGSNLNLNTSGRSDDKTEEDEEDSPTFEPIDIMNLNESNISNDSQLSGISELTSHRSRSPDFCNELSRDNFDYSNQDSQLSKVSSDSRLSIVTDFGSSNHASTPIHDLSKDEINKDKCDVKNTKDNFKAVREFESCKNKTVKNTFEISKVKDMPDVKDPKNVKNSLSSKENSRDATDSSIKDKYEHKNNKDKGRDHESSKSKSRDKNHPKDSKYHKDKSSDRKKERSHSSSKYDKHDRNKSKDKSDPTRENTEKSKDIEYSKDSSKLKEEKVKDSDKKDSSNKEAKDLKDLYKEKIRELREKKELTEKEKLNRDNKEVKSNKEYKDKKDSPKDKKPYKKEHKSSSSKNSASNTHDSKALKTSEKSADGKEKRSESRDKAKRDEKRSSKDGKSKNHFSTKSELIDKTEKQDLKKSSKSEKEEKSEKSEMKKDAKLNNDKANGKKDTRNHSQSKSSSRSDKLDSKKDSKNDSQVKDKKRRDDKKSKPKDDHSSLRKNSNDRRSTDRDGSNGSSSKSSQSSNSSANATNSKSGSSNLSKETSNVSNSSSETSDSIEEAQSNELKLALDGDGKGEMYSKLKNLESSDTNLPLKKRPLLGEGSMTEIVEMKVKKPKFAKNFHEAKKLMKIRKQIEKQKLRENKKIEKKQPPKLELTGQCNTANNNDSLASVPDEERVQIIEIPDEEYEEPYPEKQTNLTLEESSIILLGGEACAKDLLETHSGLQLKLSDMELCIKQSLRERLSNKEEEGNCTKSLKSDVQAAEFDSQMEQTSNTTESISAEDDNSIGSGKPDVTEHTSSANKIMQEKETTSISNEGVGPPTSNSVSNTVEKGEEKTENEPLTTNNTSAIDVNDSKLNNIPQKLGGSEKDNRVNVNKNTIEGTTKITSENECMAIESTSITFDDNEDCRYFKADSERSEKFSNFLEALELAETTSMEAIIESLGGQVVSSMPKAMAPPLPKRKHSSSPLTDIILNNSNNNNDGVQNMSSSPNDDTLNSIKKRKLIPAKKQRSHANLCTPQGLLNGENFVMPLSPESDVSATSEKIPSSNLIKEEKGRHRSSQRYSSDDLYKPRPLFSSSSRRSRRSNQA